MANVLIIGAGICGLGTALLLAREGHVVTVIDRDENPVPESARDAWDTWARKGVAQFRQPHNFMPGLRLLLESELPEVARALPDAGAARFDMLNPLPPFFADRAPREIDAKLWTFTMRRPAGEWVFADAAAKAPRIDVRRGVRAKEFLTGRAVKAGIPHVVGVRTYDGERLRADLVVDAMGRASRSPAWLEAIGARVPYEEQVDCGFTYYTRYFRGTEPQRVGPLLTSLGTISLLTLPGDHGTWSVTIFSASDDTALKALRDVENWTRTVRACPMQAHWLEGEPITNVLTMSGVVDRYRRFLIDGAPVATGMAAVADAWACTNPSAGRGLTVGVLQAVHLRDVLREVGDDPIALARRFDEVTEAEITPWYRAQIVSDRERFAEMTALREGREPPPPEDPLARRVAALQRAMFADVDLFRAFLEYVATVTPIEEILARPSVAQRVAEISEAEAAPRPVMPGPNRGELLAMMG